MSRVLSILGSMTFLGAAYGETNPNFERITLDDSPNRPAFIETADLDLDGNEEIIVSMFGLSPVGSGSVQIYSQTGDISKWSKRKLEGSSTRFPNSVKVTDINNDQRPDIIVPGGFLACTLPFGNCGSMRWFEQDENNSFKRHVLKSSYSRFYHHVEYVDFDQDGIKDIIAVGEEKGTFNDGSSELHIFRGNDSQRGFETMPEKIADGLGSFPTVLDLNQDGMWEVYSSEYFGSKGSFSYIMQDAKGQWQRHYLDDSIGKTIQLSFVENLYGEGKQWAIGANHTNTSDDSSAAESAVYVYEVPNFKDPEFLPGQAWKKTKISEGIVSVKSPFFGPQGAPGVFDYGDVDGDGDIDVVVHGDGDPRIFWLRQNTDKSFSTIVLDSNVPQGGISISDLDHDGVAEIVASSYEKNKLFLYKFSK